MRNLRCGGLLLVLVTLHTTLSLAQEPTSFKRDIAPLLLAHCQTCHGPKKSEGNYRVDSYAKLTAAGDSEVAGVTASRLDASELFRRITASDPEERMPSEGEPLPAEQIALVKRWIEEGAKYDGSEPNEPLAAIVPPPMHPAPPEVYTATLPITALEFSPDGAQLFVGGYHEITVWNAADGMLARRITNEGQRTYAIDLSPDGKLLAAASGTPGRLGEVRLFDATTGELVRVVANATDAVLDCRFSPDGQRIALGTADNMLAVHDVASGARQLSIGSHSDWVHAVAWSDDGTWLAGASRDKMAKVFRADTGEFVIAYNGHGQSVYGVAFHPGGQQAYSSGANNQIHFWNLSDGQKAADVASFGGEVYKLGSVDKWLFAASTDKSVRLFDRANRNQIREFKDHSEAALSAALSPDGKRLAVGAFDGSVRVWNAESGEVVTTFVAAPGYTPSLAGQ